MKAAMEQARQDAELVKNLKPVIQWIEMKKLRKKPGNLWKRRNKRKAIFHCSKTSRYCPDKALQVSKQAKQAQQQASSASDLAADAQDLLDQLPKSPEFSELEMAELPSAGMALNEIGQALEKQINALENLPSGENTSPSKFMENQGTNQDESKTDPFENSSPFSTRSQ